MNGAFLDGLDTANSVPRSRAGWRELHAWFVKPGDSSSFATDVTILELLRPGDSNFFSESFN